MRAKLNYPERRNFSKNRWTLQETRREPRPVDDCRLALGGAGRSCFKTAGIHGPKPYKFIGFGAMDVTKPYKFIGFGAMDVTKPYNSIG